jgi:thioredoxin reductase (NADPH)
MEIALEQIVIYGIVVVFSLMVIYFYVRKGINDSRSVQKKIDIAKEEGRLEPLSLHPYIDHSTCIGSGACVKACPELDILGIVSGKATVINATSCVGHGACFHACPVEAISLRIGTEKRGVDLPHVNPDYETNVKGIYIAGELGGMGLIRNSVEQGKQAVENIAKNPRSKEDDLLDLVIVGAGPAGIAGSLTAKKHGLRFATLEQDSLGGTVFTFPRSKVVMTHPMDLPLYGKVKLFDTSKEELLVLWQDVLGKNQIDVLEHTRVEKILLHKQGVFKVSVSTGAEFYTRHVLIAIGRRGFPKKLNIPGEDSAKVAYRLLEPERIHGKKIIVVGGGDSAVESAMMLMDNNEVILSYRKEQFARIKPKNEEKIDKVIQEGRLNVLFNSELIQINEKDVVLKVTGENEKIMKVGNDLVYIFIGGELPTKFLQNAGVEVTKRFGHIVKKH